MKSDDVITWRGIYRNRVWHAQPVRIVKDTPAEIVVALWPGAECLAPADYVAGKKQGKYRWNFKKKPWELRKFYWHTNRLLCLLEPEKYYSTILFWSHESNQFLCYYMNFQIPFRRSSGGIDTLDLDLDLIIHPDFRYTWKDEEDYEKAIAHDVILPEWIDGIEAAKLEILERLEKRQYPFDGSWLDWLPNPAWPPLTLPENWDKI